MYIEKERKFLVYADDLVMMDSFVKDIASMKHVIQGYFDVADANQVRVSISDGVKGMINIKGARVNYSRPEFEYKIPVEDASELIKLYGVHTIEKIRCRLKSTERLVVDVYLKKNCGLIIAEAEFSPDSKSRYIPKRKWLGTDITDIDRFYNKNLVNAPYTNWLMPLKRFVFPEEMVKEYKEQGKEEELRRLANSYYFTNQQISSVVEKMYAKLKDEKKKWEVL